MGVPKFYRWVSERYPCISQVVQEHQIPDFDNMYLDMNGIIHPCSHPNDDDPHFRKSEEEIFADIFHYIEVLFQIIKPKRVFFMAVDGVAPRAKMNQQRGRRFRSAKEAEQNIRKALEKGQVLPKEERFDSNCITPGTPFMVRLHEQLKFFVSYKISTDPAWQGLRVYLSGHETPGEGEHKIMEFIRSERVCPDYDPNTRHCLYGLDADLIMLGLSSHEPHFALLREEVKFGKASKRITRPEKITFHLLQLSLFREYLDWEFNELKDKLLHPYNLEKIIDDWILMGFLVGNDFIPHLPNLHINHDALPYLYRVYIDLMPSLDGYLHDSGKLVLPRFEKYLEALSKFDRDHFEEKFVDMKWFESKKGFTFGNNPMDFETDESVLPLDNSFAALEFMPEESVTSKGKQTKVKLNPEIEKLAAKFDEEQSDEDEDVFETEFAMHKRDYYIQKFGYEEVNRDVLAELTYQYVTGIQWILSYYFNGVPSWSWFFPFHYAPYMSDIRHFSSLEIKFELGTPFLPFEQLLAVLPAASRQLLPKPFQNLMIMEQSDIIDYYPVNFKTDLNGKQQEWEAVVLIPFIDEERLLDAMAPLHSRLTKEEVSRNKHGPCLLYTYDSSLTFVYHSSMPRKFSDISCCHARCEVLDKDVFHVAVKHMQQGLCEGVKLDVYYPGFPTLYHVPHKAQLKKAGVKVFQMHSKSHSMILNIMEPQEKVLSLRIAEDFLGKTCYVGWPHMVEALVVGVCDGIKRYFHEKKNSHNSDKEVLYQDLTELEVKSWNHQIKSAKEYQLERRGIELGETKIIIEACPIKGKRYVCGAKGLVTMEKEWSPMPVSYPYQLTVKDIHVHESHEDDKIHTIEELFPIGSQCFMLASPYYGSSGEVIEIDVKQSRVRVQLHVPPQPDLHSVIDKYKALSVNYLPAHVAAKKLGITTNLLLRISGSFLIENESRKSSSSGTTKVDIGLNMKFSKQNREALGFARRTEGGEWTFSPAALKIISGYLHKFPHLFETLAKMSSNDRCFAKDLEVDEKGSELLSEVHDWLKTIPSLQLEPVKCGSISLDDPVVEAIEQAVLSTKALNHKPKAVKVRVRPHLLFKPSGHQGAVLPDKDATFELFDRVVNVKLNVAVPFGLRGTIIGIHEAPNSSDVLYQVIFDEPFLGGLALRCSSKNVFLLEALALINISYGERCEAKKVEGRSVGNSSFGTNLASSPQLNKESKGSQSKSGDSRLDSPGAPDYSNARSNQRTIPQRNESSKSATVSTKLRTPEIQGSGSSQAQVNISKRIDRPVNERNTQNVTPPGIRKVAGVLTNQSSNSPSEFADMWKELKLKENSHGAFEIPGDTPEHKSNDKVQDTRESEVLIKEGTKALRELLQIGKAPKPKMDQQPNRPEQKGLAGKHLTVDELFRSHGSAQGTMEQFPPTTLPYHSGSSPSLALFTWCQLSGLPPPCYHHTPSAEGVSAIVELANGFKFVGSVCRNPVEAMDSAASVALFQLPRIMTNIPGPRNLVMQHQFSPVVFPSLPNPVTPQSFAGLAPLPFQKTVRQLSPQSQPWAVRTRSQDQPKREGPQSTQQRTSATLNSSAVPFIPLQVSRRSSSRSQSSPMTSQETAVKETSELSQLNESRQKEQSQDFEYQETGEIFPRNLYSESSANNVSAQSDASETNSLSVDKTERAGIPPKKMPISKRLLAPSFFSKKS